MVGSPAPAHPLTPTQRATLDAAARRMVPAAYDTPGAPMDLVARVAERLATMPPPYAADFLVAVDLLGSRVAALLVTGSPIAFWRRDNVGQDAYLRQWSRSRLAACRTVFQAVRRLLIVLYYAAPETQQAMGFRGAPHRRVPAVPWEGPAIGVATDDEPIARAATPPTVPPIVPPRRLLTVTGELPRTTDVLVIGTGAGGGVTAARLAEAGFEVTVIEAGPLVQGDAFDEHEAHLNARLYADQGMRATKDQSVSIIQGGAVGGGTTVNWMIMLRTPPHVLDEWTERHGTVGMSPAELAPVFDDIEDIVHARRVPDDAHSPNNRLILDGAARLGWRASSAMINARGCVRAGTCGTGCRYDAKQGTLLVWLPRAVGAGARLVADARATRMEIVRDGGAVPRKRVTVARLDPRTRQPVSEATIDARLVVLAAGAVETPLLLQRSGLGGGGVGNWLRLHPTTPVAAVYDREIYGASGIPLSTVCDEFLVSDANGYGFWIESPTMQPMLTAVAASGWGAEHRGLMARFRNLSTLIALTRDGADCGLSNGSVRPRGTTGAVIRYRLGPADRHHVVESIVATARLHLANGAREVLTRHTEPLRIRSERDLAAIRSQRYGPNEFSLFSAHVNGTCRMGTDPRTSGTTPDGERHGVPGLYVCDGSLLPTALGVNPQETIMAVCAVVAARIAHRHPK